MESYTISQPCGCIWKYEKKVTHLSKIILKPCPEHPCDEPFRPQAISWNEWMEVKSQYKNE